MRPGTGTAGVRSEATGFTAGFPFEMVGEGGRSRWSRWA